jgi:hypothetical protein
MPIFIVIYLIWICMLKIIVARITHSIKITVCLTRIKILIVIVSRIAPSVIIQIRVIAAENARSKFRASFCLSTRNGLAA